LLPPPKNLNPLGGGAELTIVPYTLLLPTKPMEVPKVVSSTHVEVLE